MELTELLKVKFVQKKNTKIIILSKQIELESSLSLKHMIHG